MRLYLLLFSAVALLSSCEYFDLESVDGNGKITTSERNMGGFKSVEVQGAIEVHVQQNATSSVKVEADENLLQYIEITNEKGTLLIRPKQGFNLEPTKDIVVYAAAPAFEELEASGASKIISDGTLSGNELELHASGASELKMEVNVSKLKAEVTGASHLGLKGKSQTVSTEASGASSIKCMDLATEETTLDLSGASNAEISASKQLNIEASGASNVKYRGSAAINQQSSGASSVEKVG